MSYQLVRLRSYLPPLLRRGQRARTSSVPSFARAPLAAQVRLERAHPCRPPQQLPVRRQAAARQQERALLWSRQLNVDRWSIPNPVKNDHPAIRSGNERTGRAINSSNVNTGLFTVLQHDQDFNPS